MSDIFDLWNDPFNPDAMPDMEGEHRYPAVVQDSGGTMWTLGVTYYQPDKNDKGSRVLVFRYTSKDDHPIVVEQHVMAPDFKKLDDYQWTQRRLEELQQMIEEKVKFREAAILASKRKVGHG